MPTKSKLTSRIRNRLLRELRHYFDSYSLYYNLPPLTKKIERLAGCGKIGTNTSIIGRLKVPTPEYIELKNNVSLKELDVAAERYIFVENNVNDNQGINTSEHCIKTINNTYYGSNIGKKIVTISVDVEGGVALSHASEKAWKALYRFWGSKNNVVKLSQLFKKYQLPVTWAICGHLFLKECQGDHGFDEQDWFGDWFKYDPKSSYLDDASWYMPDIIEELKKEPLFEIGYHSFGHFNYSRCSEITVDLDIKMAQRIREEWGLDLNVFVFPYNQCGHFDLVSKEGKFKYIRGNIGSKYPAVGIIDFKNFCFFNTSQMFCPDTLDVCDNQLNKAGSSFFNYYTHCYQWSQKDRWQQLEGWLKKLSKLRELKFIEIVKMGDLTERK